MTEVPSDSLAISTLYCMYFFFKRGGEQMHIVCDTWDLLNSMKLARLI